MQPAAQMSTGAPYGCCRMISGARYLGGRRSKRGSVGIGVSVSVRDTGTGTGTGAGAGTGTGTGTGRLISGCGTNA